MGHSTDSRPHGHTWLEFRSGMLAAKLFPRCDDTVEESNFHADRGMKPPNTRSIQAKLRDTGDDFTL